MSDTPETNAALFDAFDGQGGEVVFADFARRLERERDEALLTIQGFRDQLCADKCRDKAAADGGWANI